MCLSESPPPSPPLPPAGEGRVHKCLRDNRKQLSDTCRKEELLLEEKEVSVVWGRGGKSKRSCFAGGV